MRKSILLFVLFTLTSIPLLLFAQGGYQVTGHIISAEDNQPMIGVSVLEKGTTNGVITDINGNYSITVTKSPATGSICESSDLQARTRVLEGEMTMRKLRVYPR